MRWHYCTLLADSVRHQTIANELMRTNDPDRARREFAEATKNRVLAAVRAQQRAKAEANAASSAGVSS